MTNWAKPSWRAPWNGDPEHVLNATSAVLAVLTSHGITSEAVGEVEWEGGSREVSSVEDAREALRFTERPREVHFVVSMLGRPVDEAVSVRGGYGKLLVFVKLRESFALADELIAAARGATPVEASPDP